MIDVKVLGPGCANCERLERMVLEALTELEGEIPEIEVGFEKVTDPMRFHEFGVLSTPGLIINDQVVISGRVPTADQVRDWLRAGLE
jgi:small redox-active disulfide protein 2